MATKSILKDVRFRDKSLCRGFAAALESSKRKKYKKGAVVQNVPDHSSKYG